MVTVQNHLKAKNFNSSMGPERYRGARRRPRTGEAAALGRGQAAPHGPHGAGGRGGAGTPAMAGGDGEDGPRAC